MNRRAFSPEQRCLAGAGSEPPPTLSQSLNKEGCEIGSNVDPALVNLCAFSSSRAFSSNQKGLAGAGNEPPLPLSQSLVKRGPREWERPF